MTASLLKSGQQVAGYEVIALVGKGGMGEVYRARQVSMDRAVALKILAPKLVKRDPAFAQRFVDEARAAGRLSHPNIVGVHDVGETTLATEAGNEPIHYFSMEFVEGETVKDVLAKVGALPLAQVGEIMTAMVEALVYAEAQGVVHRDIKPENIMVSPTGEVKLADLGLAQQVGSENQDTEGKGRKVMGTPMYMSPEQARGLAVGHASDQYSLGATLYHMLTGQPPFRGADARALMRAHVLEPVPDPKQVADVPDAWRQVCMRMMAKDPAERLPNAVELRAVVRAAVLGEGAHSKRLRGQRSRPFSTGNGAAGMPPAIRKAVIVAVIATVGLVAFAVMQLSGRTTPVALPVTSAGPGVDRALVAARALIAALPGEPGAALSRLDQGLTDGTLSPAARELLQLERGKRQQALAAREQAAVKAQIAALDRIDERIAAGELAQARSEYAAIAEQPDRAPARKAATKARLDQALASVVEQLQLRIRAAEDDQALRRVEADLAAAPLSPEQQGKIAEVALVRRAELLKAAHAAALVAAAGPRWIALSEALESLRYSVRYDEVQIAVGSVVDGFPTPEAKAQAKTLIGLTALAQQGEMALRSHIKAHQSQVTVRLDGELKEAALLSITDKELHLRPPNGASVRRSRQTTTVDYRPLLAAALESVEAKERERIIAAFLFFWNPSAARSAFLALGDEPLAQAVAAVESRRPGGGLGGRLLRQDGGRVQVHYDFLPGDRGPLADFAGEGLETSARGLLWKNSKTMAKDDFAEASLPTVRWKGRLQPPLTIQATLRLAPDTQATLVGVEAGGACSRLAFNAKNALNLPTVRIGTLFTGEGQRFTGKVSSALQLDLTLPLRVEVVVDEQRRLSLSYNDTVVEQGRQLAEGPISWIMQLYQREGASSLEVETLTLEGVWAE